MAQQWTPPCGTWIRRDVDDANRGFVIAAFRADGALTVTPVRQPDGNWTITAVFAPCRDGTESNQGGD